jgi:hypothetical protein
LLLESLPLWASVISSFSRAGLNVVDRKQFQKERACPLVIGYWNNLLPLFLVLPIIFFSPASSYCLDDLLSLDIVFLSILIQFVAYAFSFSFKKLRVTDIAVLSKAADITVPLVLAIAGFYSVSYGFFLLLPIILIIFISSAGINNVRKSYQSSIVLVFMLTAQGVYAYFADFNVPFNREFWGLISVSFSVLVWRFVFSGLFLLHMHRISYFYIFPGQFLSSTGFYLRGFLTVLTQVSFVFAITAKNLMIVWPILNATGLLGAVFAYLFLGEKLNKIDFFYILSAFLITGFVIVSLNYDKF